MLALKIVVLNLLRAFSINLCDWYSYLSIFLAELLFQMNHFSTPKLSVPPPLIVSEEGSFAYYTFTSRLPAILEQVVQENEFLPSEIEKIGKLSQELLGGLVRPIAGEGTDINDWNSYVSPFLGSRIVDTPFYFAETYFYRRLLEATNYFAYQVAERTDPFELQKRRSLEKVIGSIRAASSQIQSFNIACSKRDELWKQTLSKLLYLNLWGNRIDLSLHPTGADRFKQQKLDIDCDQSHVILDDTVLVIDQIVTFHQKRIDFIVDNAGFELVSDLIVSDFLLAAQAAEVIYIHLKSHPTFVSDATKEDVFFTLEFLANDTDSEVRNLGNRLQSYIASDRLRLVDDFFWTAPLFFWEMPSVLQQFLSQSDLIFIKGDANYRRLIGDCHWEKSSSFKEIVCYFPSTFVILRTLKSEVIVDLNQSQIDGLQQQDPHWLTNGKWGIISFSDY